MSKFADIPWYIIEQYLNIIAEKKSDAYYSENVSNNSVITGPRNIFISDNLTSPLRLYAKNDESDYKELKVSVPSDWKDYNLIKLNSIKSKETVFSNEVDRIVKEYAVGDYTLTITSTLGGTTDPEGIITLQANEYSYIQTSYDYLLDNLEDPIKQGDKIYTRKDSQFINDWITDNWEKEPGSENFKDFLNKNQKYLYLGSGFEKGTNILEIHYWAIKDWMRNAVPVNNQHPDFMTFIDLIFDRLYNKLYNKQKNMFSLIDPYEVEYEFFDNLVRFYGTEPLESITEKFRNRLFIENLIYLLKKRGTYAALFIIWEMLAEGTNNKLTVYDRWHDPVAPPIVFSEDKPNYNNVQIWWREEETDPNEGKLFVYHYGNWVETASESLSGSLTVNINGNFESGTTIDPPTGELWKLSNSLDKYEDGETVNLPIGSYTIEFEPFSGWDKPTDTNIIVYNDYEVIKNFDYVRYSGSIKINIEPSEVISDGAQWKIIDENGDDYTTWINTDEKFVNVEPGNYSIKFKDIYGWDEPFVQTNDYNLTNITVEKDSSFEQTVSYSRQYGYIYVELFKNYEDKDAVPNSTEGWTVKGLGTDFISISNNVTKRLPVNNDYTISFTNYEEEWSPPENITDVEIEKEKTTALSGIYEQLWGYLEVDSVADIGTDTREWTIYQGPTTENYDYLKTKGAKTNIDPLNVLVGNYQIEFEEHSSYNIVNGNIKDVTVGPENDTPLNAAKVEAEYEMKTGDLQVILEAKPDTETITSDHQWRVRNISWKESGDIASNLPINRDYYIEFKDVDGWITPNAISGVWLKENETVIEKATYEKTYELTVNLTKDDPPADHTFYGMGPSTMTWSIVGDNTSYFADKTIVLKAGTYTVEVHNIHEDYETPANFDVTLDDDKSFTKNYTFIG